MSRRMGVSVEELVSVIIPVYNRQDTISRAVDSVLRQTYTNIEVIIVDDGSTDDTLAILESYSDSRIQIFNQNHKGACAARNRGINESKGFYIAFQDSDDEWIPDKLWKQIAYMKDNHFAICYCPYELHDNDICIIPSDYFKKDKYENDITNILKCGNVISTQTLILEKSVLDTVGKFDDEMPRFQDYELVIRIIQKYKIGYYSEVLVRVYRQKNCITNNDSVKKEAIYRLISRHKDFFEHNFLIHLIVAAIDIFEKENIDIDYLIRLQEASGLSAGEFGEVVVRLLHKKYFSLLSLFKLQQRQQYDSFESKLQTEQFAIYGAGKYAKMIFDILLRKNLRPKCFLVSDISETGKNIYGIPIENPQKEYRNMPILIGVSIKKQAEIIRYLSENGFDSYCMYPVYELERIEDTEKENGRSSV